MADVCAVTISKWKAASSLDDPKQFEARALEVMMDAAPLPKEHPLLKRHELEHWAQHRWAFGRAQAGLSLCEIPESHREEAISLLGRCFVYSRGCASAHFGAVIEKLDFIEASGTAREVQ